MYMNCNSRTQMFGGINGEGHQVQTSAAFVWKWWRGWGRVVTRGESCECSRQGDQQDIFRATAACPSVRNKDNHPRWRASPWRPLRRRHNRAHCKRHKLQTHITELANEGVIDILPIHTDMQRRRLQGTYLLCWGQSTWTSSHVIISAYMSLRRNTRATTLRYKTNVYMSEKAMCECGVPSESWIVNELNFASQKHVPLFLVPPPSYRAWFIHTKAPLP